MYLMLFAHSYHRINEAFNMCLITITAAFDNIWGIIMITKLKSSFHQYAIRMAGNHFHHGGVVSLFISWFSFLHRIYLPSRFVDATFFGLPFTLSRCVYPPLSSGPVLLLPILLGLYVVLVVWH